MFRHCSSNSSSTEVVIPEVSVVELSLVAVIILCNRFAHATGSYCWMGNFDSSSGRFDVCSGALSAYFQIVVVVVFVVLVLVVVCFT